jgi:hypothetical protein
MIIRLNESRGAGTEDRGQRRQRDERRQAGGERCKQKEAQRQATHRDEGDADRTEPVNSTANSRRQHGRREVAKQRAE